MNADNPRGLSPEQLDAEARQVLAEMPDDIDELDQAGVFVAGGIQVQCLGCGEVLKQLFTNEHDPDDLWVECPTCSAELGKPVRIAVAFLVGEEVDQYLTGADVDAEQPFAEDGPGGPLVTDRMEPQTDDGDGQGP